MKRYLWLCLLLLVGLIGCSDDNQDSNRQINPFGSVIIGPGDSYNSHVYRNGEERQEYERNENRQYGQYRTEGTNRGGYQARPESGRGDRDSDPSGDDVAITGYNVKPAAGPPLDQFTLSMHDVTYALNPLHVTSVGYTTFNAQTADSTITKFLNQRTHNGNVGVRNITLAVSPQTATITAIVNMNNRDMNAVATGMLQPLNGTRVIFVPTSFTVNNVPLATATQQDILNQINPVLDVNGLKCNPVIQRVTLAQGAVVISGTATPNNLP